MLPAWRFAGVSMMEVLSASATLDRFLLHHAEVVTIIGRSYRLRNKGRGDEATKEQKKPRKPKDKCCQENGQ